MPKADPDILVVVHGKRNNVALLVMDPANEERACEMAAKIATETGRAVTVCDESGNKLFEVAEPARN